MASPSPHRSRNWAGLPICLLLLGMALAPTSAAASIDPPAAPTPPPTPPTSPTPPPPPPAPPAQAGSEGCIAAEDSVANARADVAAAKRKLRRARGRAKRRRARRALTRARARLNAALQAQERACGPGGTGTPGPGPPGPGTQPPANQSPSFPPQTMQGQYQNQYAIVLGVPRISAQTVTITISPGAVDPDGDPLTYTWTASNGAINGSGLSATWVRVVTNYVIQPGVVTVTANDGKGGTATYNLNF